MTCPILSLPECFIPQLNINHQGPVMGYMGMTGTDSVQVGGE